MPTKLQTLQDAARARGVDLDIHTVSTAEEIAPAIDAAKASGAAGLNVLASPLFYVPNQRIIFERTAALGLPAMYQWPEQAHEGGLVAYGPSIVQIYRLQLSRQLAEVLRGTKPADIPVEQPTKFELVVNLKTAKALGLALPPSVAKERSASCSGVASVGSKGTWARIGLASPIGADRDPVNIIHPFRPRTCEAAHT